MNWQPIATAPKDGTKILVFTVHGDVEVSEWFISTMRVDEPVEVAGETLFRHREEIYHEGWNGNYPTHWMPLPDPPKVDDETPEP